MLARLGGAVRHLSGATARELRGWLLLREQRISALEREIETIALLREQRIRELEAEIAASVAGLEGRIRELEGETAALVADREMRIRELELEIEQSIAFREARIRELESEIEGIADAARARLLQREDRVRELEALVDEFQNPDPPWDQDAPAIDRAMMAWEATIGWCSEAKARWLVDLVSHRRTATVLEIGVFGGKSFLPMAAAMTCWDGTAYGVESWSSEVSVAESTGASNDQWWSSVDMKAVKSRFYAAVARLGLASTIRMLELPSDEAWHALRETAFGLIHIDGSHAPQQALRDVQQWSALLAPDGLLVVDDIDWDTLADVRAWLDGRFQLVDLRREHQGSYAAYARR
jgi:predicted O-methyltransferase YrrM